MPVHDWNRVTAETFHDFHLAWIAELRRALNGGLLPRGYYALAEPVAGDIIPDVLTLWPPGNFDPSGIHGALWAMVGGTFYHPRTDRPLTLAAYAVRGPGLITAYVEPIGVGAELPEMPLFLASEHYVNVPLEETYRAAWQGVPERWRRVIESQG